MIGWVSDYAKGFGGKYGVQADRKDKCALGWEDITKTEKHSSQVDMNKGFGGKFGVETDKQDKSAYSFEEVEKPRPAFQKPKPDIGVPSERASSLRSRFENMAKSGEEDRRKSLEEERRKREEKDRKDKEESKKAEEQRQRKLREEHKRIDEMEERQRALEGSTDDHHPPSQEPVESRHEDSELIRPGTRKDHSRVSVIPRELVVPSKVDTSPDAPSTPEEPAAPKPTPTQASTMASDTTSHRVSDPLQARVAAAAPALPSSPLPQQEPPKKVVPQIHHSPVESESSPESGPGESLEEGIYEQLEPTPEQQGKGMSAVALYDYQAADFDEISFDPDDIITDIETIDEGWWRGKCNGKVGLFPANYVQPLY